MTPSKLVQLIFVINALRSGWSVTVVSSGVYKFTDTLEHQKNAHDKNFTQQFMNSNLLL